MSKSKVAKWGSLSVFLAACFCCTSCGKKSESLSSEDSKKMLETLAKPNQEAIVILSYRYEIKPQQIEAFLDQYLCQTDEGYSAFKTVVKGGKMNSDEKGAEALVLKQEQYANALANASQAIGIPVKVAANIVCDYHAFTRENATK